MKKICTALVCALILLSPLYSIGRRDEPARTAGQRIAGGELRFGITTEPTTFDPLSPSNTADGRSILFNIFEGLVKPTPDGNLQPAVAEQYIIDHGGLIYIFRLRQGIRFHDGSFVTPEDVVFSLNTAKSAGFNGLSQIESVEITTDRYIKITLNTPDGDFLPYLAVGIVPRNNANRERNPIGTGPFSVLSYTPQNTLVLVKNPYYWNNILPHLDRVTYVFLADSDALLLALRGGSIESASISGAIAEQIDPNRFDIIPYPSNAVQLLALNNNVRPLNDRRVRMAINYAVDIQEIINIAFYGRGEPSGSPVIPALSVYYNNDLRNPYPVNLQRARSLLAEAGFANGFPLVITVPSNFTMHVDTAQVIVNQLGRVGITASVRLVDWATWLSDVYRGRRFEATIISVDSPTVSPRGFLYRYQSNSEGNFINFVSPRFDEVYAEILGEIDPHRRMELYKQAQAIVSEEAASVFIQDIWGFRVFPRGRFGGLLRYPLYVTDFSTVYRIQ